MKTTQTITLTLVLSLSLATVAHAQATEEAAPDGFHIAVDTDPSMFALNGYSAWAVARLPIGNGVKVGGGLFALDVPEPVSTLMNGAPGFAMRLNGYMAHGSYFLTREGRGGLYTGAYVGALETRYQRADTPNETASVWHATVMPMIGYQWFPLATDLYDVDVPLKGILDGFYIEPWLGASIWLPVAGEPVVGAKRFNEPPGVPFPAIHIGYEL